MPAQAILGGAGDTEGHDPGPDMRSAAEPSVLPCVRLTRGGHSRHSLWGPFWGASPAPAPPTHRVHGETGSIPIQGAAELPQLMVNPVPFPGSGQEAHQHSGRLQGVIGGLGGQRGDPSFSEMDLVLKPPTLSLCERFCAACDQGRR